MDRDISVDIQRICMTDDQSLVDVTEQLQLDPWLPGGTKAREELLKTPMFKDREERIHNQFVFHGQCLVLGDSRVGKTSLVKSLTGRSFDLRQAKTQGVEVSLVDEKWKNKDFRFGNLIPFFKTVSAQLALFGRRAGNMYFHTGTRTSLTRLITITLDTFFYAFLAVSLHMLGLASASKCQPHKSQPHKSQHHELDIGLAALFLIIVGVVGFFELRVTSYIKGYLSRLYAHVNIYMQIIVSGNIPSVTVGFFLFVMTKCYLTFRYQKPETWPTIIYICIGLSFVTVGVLILCAFFLFRRIQLKNPILRKCRHLGGYKFHFSKTQCAMVAILFCRFITAVFTGYISGMVLFFSVEVHIPKKVTCDGSAESVAFIWHILLAVESVKGLIESLPLRWCSFEFIFLVFVLFSFCVKLLPSSIYFVVVYTTLFSSAFYINCFQFMNYDQDTNMFAAIFVENAVLHGKRLKSELNRKYSSLTLEILDFAGDKEYYSYHHLFFRHKALYVIVFNMAEFADNNLRDLTPGIQRLQFWIEAVSSHVPPSAPIFLVGTHRGNMDDNCVKLLNNHLRRFLWKTCSDSLVMNDPENLIFFPVENEFGNKDNGIQALQRKIMFVARDNKTTLGRDIPLSWIRFQDAIINLRFNAKAKSCVSFAEFPRTLQIIAPFTWSWSKETLNYFHEKGLIIYLDKREDLDLSNWILLNPQILVDIIVQLLTPPPESNQPRGLRNDWDLLQSKGILTNTLLESIISKVGENKEAITAFLEHCDLICPLVHKMVEIERGHSCMHGLQPTHFVPSLLPMSADGSAPVWHDTDTDKKFYIFFGKFLPEALFHRMLSRAQKNSDLEFPNGQTVLYRDTGKFWMNPWLSYKLKLIEEEKLIEITYRSGGKNKMQPSDVLCQVFSMVDGICRADFHFVKFHCGPVCPSETCPGHQDDYLKSLPTGENNGTRRPHVYNIMPGRQGDRTPYLYCENHCFEAELEEWIPKTS